MKIEVYVARDKDGDLFLYKEKPIKKGIEWSDAISNSWFLNVMGIDNEEFPEVTWKDEKPTKVILTIEKA